MEALTDKSFGKIIVSVYKVIPKRIYIDTDGTQYAKLVIEYLDPVAASNTYFNSRTINEIAYG